MRLGQIRWNNMVTAAIFDAAGARPIPEHTVYDLICRSEKEGKALPAMATQMAASHAERPVPLIPLNPKEVWACGCTYETSAAFRDAEHGTREGFYSQVYREGRPEIFFKGTNRMCVGPGQPIGIRSDARFTAPEPELGLVLGAKGKILGYTLGNDVSAWDIERQNPLYLAQSKLYQGACALGPVIVTADAIADPYSIEMECVIKRDNQVLFSGKASTASLNRKFETLTEYLLRSNPVPAGSVLLTGTGIIVTEEAALAEGDTVTIRSRDFGELVNPAAIVVG